MKGTDDSPIVKFAGVESRTDAEGLRGFVLQVPAAELPELDEGEFYSFELEGLEVRSLNGEVVGTVTEVLESPAHDLLAIELAPGGEMLAPFVHEFVPEVELESGYLVVDMERLRPADDD
jgi:16S rRNA processing protein RimM